MTVTTIVPVPVWLTTTTSLASLLKMLSEFEPLIVTVGVNRPSSPSTWGAKPRRIVRGTERKRKVKLIAAPRSVCLCVKIGKLGMMAIIGAIRAFCKPASSHRKEKTSPAWAKMTPDDRGPDRLASLGTCHE